jgi:dimethylargininase
MLSVTNEIMETAVATHVAGDVAGQVAAQAAPQPQIKAEYLYRAVTRDLAPSLGWCELTFRGREVIDLPKAAAQLERYRQILRAWEVETVSIPAADTHPDCCFVQDTAVVLDEVCVMASMGAKARQGETEEVERTLASHREIRHIYPPATLDGGDVVQVGRRLFAGLSTRTNALGLDALRKIVGPFGYTVVPVEVRGSLHLTTGCGVVNDETILLNPRWVDSTAFTGLRQLHVPEPEPWAANTIRVEESVCLETGAPWTVELVSPFARSIETVDISEFRKAEGSLSCLSLMFRDALQ